MAKVWNSEDVETFVESLEYSYKCIQEMGFDNLSPHLAHIARAGAFQLAGIRTALELQNEVSAARELAAAVRASFKSASAPVRGQLNKALQSYETISAATDEKCTNLIKGIK